MLPLAAYFPNFYLILMLSLYNISSANLAVSQRIASSFAICDEDTISIFGISEYFYFILIHFVLFNLLFCLT